MGTNKSIDSYYIQMNSLLRRWHSNNMPNNFLVNTFIGGVWHDALRINLQQQNCHDVLRAYTLAKTWKEVRINTNFA